jgi:hypothetical protein
VLLEIDRMIGPMTDSFNVQYNKGRWKSHEHAHMKVTIDEPTFRRIKRDHLSACERSLPPPLCGAERMPSWESRARREHVR